MKKWLKIFRGTFTLLVVGMLAGVAWGPLVEASGLTPLVDNIRPSVQAAWTEHSPWLRGCITIQFTGFGPDTHNGMSYLNPFRDGDASRIGPRGSPLYTFAWDTDAASNGPYGVNSISVKSTNPEGIVMDYSDGRHIYTCADIFKERKEVKVEEECLRRSKLPIINIRSVSFLEADYKSQEGGWWC